MKYAKIKKNDTVNCDGGIAVSLFMQGCPHHCPECWNPETWNPADGKEISKDNLIKELKNDISANSIKRNFSILGGEPFVEYNINDTKDIVYAIKDAFPNIKIIIWTGYTIEELQTIDVAKQILSKIDIFIDGRYVKEKRDITLKLRGSSNQRILRRGVDF